MLEHSRSNQVARRQKKGGSLKSGEMGPRVVQPEDLLGPLNAFERKFAPKELFVCGATELLAHGPRVSVVGSRKASEEGLHRTQLLCRLLVERGVVIVSGLAEGIDRAAHETAFESKGRTVGVLGTPLERFYPAANRDLQIRMMREQLVVSQFEAGTRTQPWHFPQRNRLMALIADATIIVEAGESSGTLSQGWESLRIGRPLFLLESVASNPTLKWPADMMRYGALVLSRSNMDDLFEELPSRTNEELMDALVF